MLCRFFEEGKEKCYEYFPKSEGKLVFGDFVIECISRSVIPDTDGATCGILEVKNRGRKEKIQHIWYENWMDHAAPENFKASFELVQIARAKRNNAPVVVHCSAGIGRTGCFVGIELAAHMVATRTNFKMESVLKEMRDQRMQSIQNDVQYLYIHRGLLECLIRKGVTKRMDVLKFITDYDNLVKRKKNREVEKDVSVPREEKSKDYTPSVYYTPFNLY
ncbi:Protein-tyrosine phosphatase [Necator americanus]|nr:Protein-tyrosine phosphatase [Necator americanus]ETN73350.1 Protein-tyrosine phosphatase [Necator americanus]